MSFTRHPGLEAAGRRLGARLVLALVAVCAAALSRAAEPVQVTDDAYLNYMPSLLETADGDLLIVYERLDQAAQNGDLMVTVSTDGGDGWSEPEIAIGSSGNERHPSLVQLLDGTFRLYYLSNETGSYKIHHAVSADGLDWSPSGVVDLGWTNEALVNPTVCRESDGSLTMAYDYLSHGGYVAHSTDGVVWDHDRVQVSTGPLNRIMRHSDGTYVLSYQRRTGTQSWQIDVFTRTSTDRVEWSPEQRVTTVQNCHDSFPLELADGEYQIFYAVSQGGSPYDLFSQGSTDGSTWTDEESWFPYAGWDTQPHPILLSSGDVGLAWARGPGQTTTEVFFARIGSPASLDHGVEPAHLPVLEIAPNPFRDRVTIVDRSGDSVGASRAVAQVASIFSSDGRRVTSLSASAREGAFVWDGTDDSGHRVPPGVYWVLVGAVPTPRAAKVLLVR